MKRLFKELNIFKIAIIIALLLAMISAVLSIVSPNQLSKLTDEIQNGLVVKKDNIELITNTITNNLSNIDMNKVMTSNVSEYEKTSLINSLSSLKDNNIVNFVNTLENTSNELINIILPEFKVDNTLITSNNQLEYLKVMSSINEDINVFKLYKKIDELPTNIQSVIKPYMNMDAILKITIFLIILYIISALFSFLESIIMTIVSNKFAYKLRDKISNKINKLPLKYFDKNQIGDTLSRVTNDVDTIAQSMNQSLATLVSSITLFVGTLIMMFITNYIMALTAVLSSIIGFILMGLVLSKSQKYFKARQKELGKLNSHIEEVYSGLLVVKAYNGKKESDKKFDELNKKVYDANRKSQFLGGLMPSTMMFIGNFGYVAVCVVGAILTQNNIITFGVIVAFMTYVRLFTNPFSQIAQAFTALQSTAAASERVFEFLDEEEMIKEKALITLDKNKVKGNIEFDHIKFAYDEDKIIIKDFTAKVSHGQKVAIVGPTGAGKTTMVNLLMKFYDIKNGDIKIDGVSIKDLSRENIHELFTMVLQDTWLFNGSVKDNIIFNRKNISMDQVEKVCDTVGLTHFIKTLPNTFDSNLEEGDLVSSGQKQLLTIARGMIENAPFLILDEATSNVDTRTESLVQKAMDKLTQNKTSFIIAHRLSTIKNADLILVMKDGNIIEQGNHESLLKQNGFYAELYNSQFQN
ncbi:MAG: ABC transporter ATP-binding protein [Bacilli bacterium]|nr:ABC transporter ATP-binding protein [Bacilli bacterium]